MPLTSMSLHSHPSTSIPPLTPTPPPQYMPHLNIHDPSFRQIPPSLPPSLPSLSPGAVRNDLLYGQVEVPHKGRMEAKHEADQLPSMVTPQVRRVSTAGEEHGLHHVCRGIIKVQEQERLPHGPHPLHIHQLYVCCMLRVCGVVCVCDFRGVQESQ